jgi:hypothetical protein
LKRLEMLEKPKDPCPLKRARTPPPSNDEVVSLNFMDDEMEDELLALAGVSGSGSGKSRYATLKEFLSRILTKTRSVPKHNSSLALDLHNNK